MSEKWEASGNRVETPTGTLVVSTRHGMWGTKEGDIALAARVTREHNAHGGLLAACQAVVGDYEHLCCPEAEEDDVVRKRRQKRVDQMRAAIAAATEEG